MGLENIKVRDPAADNFYSKFRDHRDCRARTVNTRYRHTLGTRKMGASNLVVYVTL